MSASQISVGLLVPPILTGITAGLGAHFLFSRRMGSINFMGGHYRLATGIGLTVGGASLAGQLTQQFVGPMVGGSPALSGLLNASPTMLTMGATAAFLGFNDMNALLSTNGALTIALAGGAQIGGDYLTVVLDPYLPH
jgi:hypothetical protein